MLKDMQETQLNILKAKEQFEKQVEKEANGDSKKKLNPNPLLLSAEIQRSEELLKKRKVAFLEVETKDWFLKSLLSYSSVSTEDLEGIERETARKKDVLKTEKQQVSDLEQEVSQLRQEVCLMYEEHQTLVDTNCRRLAELEEMVTEVADLEELTRQTALPVADDEELNTSRDGLRSLEEFYQVQQDTITSNISDNVAEIAELKEATESLAIEAEALNTNLEGVLMRARETVETRQYMEAHQRSKEITAAYYRAAIRSIAALHALTDLVIHDERDDAKRVAFSIQGKRYTLVVGEATGLEKAHVHGFERSTVAQALEKAKQMPLHTQPEGFVKTLWLLSENAFMN
jgi:hypothetical protein